MHRTYNWTKWWAFIWFEKFSLSHMHTHIIWLIVTELELTEGEEEKKTNKNVVVGITWKYELHAESTTLCAWSCLPSAASVTSTRASLCKSDENTDIKFGWWLFQRKQNCCTDIFSLISVYAEWNCHHREKNHESMFHRTQTHAHTCKHTTQIRTN